jgi:hypothetical protein
VASNTIEKILRLKDEASKPLLKMAIAAEKAAKAADGLEDTVEDLEQALSDLDKEAADAASGLDDVGESAKKTDKKTGGLADRMGGPATKAFKMAGAAALATGAAFAALGVSSIQVGSEMEGFETRLGVLMGTTSAAKTRLAELFEIGTTTPFELGSLVEAEINLRALGVEAESALPLIMDFAGAMGVELSTAAVEVGRAMQFGAGAVETIAGRALRAQVELRTGQNALKMSTEEFKAALIETLKATDGIFAGGTEKLAATFSGMMSNLSDAWFKFRKEVADAGLFLTAKATLDVILERLDSAKQSTAQWAGMVSGGVIDSFTGVVIIIDAVAQSVIAVVQLALILENAVRGIGQMWNAVAVAAGQVAVTMGELDVASGGMFSEKGALQAAADLRKYNQSLKESKIAMLEASQAILENRHQMAMLAVRAKEVHAVVDLFEDIKIRAQEMEKALQIEAQISVTAKFDDDVRQLMQFVGLSKEEAQMRVSLGMAGADMPSITAVDVKPGRTSSGGGARGPSTLDRLAGQVAALTKRAFPITQIEAAGRLLTELEAARGKANKRRRAGFDELIAQAEHARSALQGIEITKATDKLQTDLDAMAKGMEGVGPAMDDLTASTAQMVDDLRTAQVQAIAGGVQAGVGAMTDISGALGALGPGGAAVGAVAGLGEAAAGEEGGLEALVTQNVEGFVDGMVALLEQLPDVISKVIPKLLGEGIPKLIVALAKATPAMAKALMIDLPATLVLAFGRAFSDVWDAVKAFFRDLFSMDGLGGSIADGFMEVVTLGMWDSSQSGGFVNRTGLKLLHAGEYVQPTSGTMPQSARGRMSGGGGGMSITINTNVVDPNSIDQLGRMLQRHFGAMGRTTLPIFGGA